MDIIKIEFFYGLNAAFIGLAAAGLLLATFSYNVSGAISGFCRKF
jgi:hypothetical protein